MPAPLQAASSSRPTAAQPFAVHRCRFVDFTPSAITAIAFPPLALPKVSAHTSKNINRSGRRFGSLAVGRANGNIEIYEWATSVHEQERSPRTPQAWVLSRVCTVNLIFYTCILKLWIRSCMDPSLAR